MSYVKDTIAARATAQGRGGIGIVRVSGPEVRSIARDLLGFLPEPRYATYCSFEGTDHVIDEGIAIFFNAPGSFTGEDVLELQGHGGPVVLDMLLNRVLSLGARIALPGEFSQRAFLNDKIDLTQAEAIADLINSGTEAAARGALRSMQGEFSSLVNAIVARVIELRVYVEAAIDFPEEEVDFISDDNVEARLKEIIGDVEKVLAETTSGVLLVEGASVALIGKPNAGKSSLMNLLTGRETSIVTDIPGTTRDVVNETLQLDGIPLRLIDTAGLRDSEDIIEAEGVRRARAAGAEADLVLVVIDASQADAMDDVDGYSKDPRAIVVLNKKDLVDTSSQVIQQGVASGALLMSATTRDGLEALKGHLKLKLGFSPDSGSGFTARSRHIVSLRACRDSLHRASDQLAHRAGELVAEELRACQAHLSDITGEFTADDLLGEIFGNFCIGK